jgi:hypothetical protein
VQRSLKNIEKQLLVFKFLNLTTLLNSLRHLIRKSVCILSDNINQNKKLNFLHRYRYKRRYISDVYFTLIRVSVVPVVLLLVIY